MMRIEEILKEKKISKNDLAARLGVRRQTVFHHLTGNPSLEILQRIADALGVHISELFAPPTCDVITCPKCGQKFKMIE